MILARATQTATAAAANGTSNKRRPLDRSSRTGLGFTTCTATSGNGLRIAGMRATTGRQQTDQPGSKGAIRVTVLSAAVPGATNPTTSALPPAVGAISTSSSTLSASGSLER